MKNIFFYFPRKKLNAFSHIAILLLLSVTLIVNNTSASITHQISAGGLHTVALKIGKTVWAWGNNTYGQLGNGTNNDSNTPAQVSGISDIVAIAGGFWHTVALESDGTVWTWGNNTYGQLGDGTNTDRNTPVQVNELSDINVNVDIVIPIAGGHWHTVALKSDGTAWALGNNFYGQLGNGSYIDSNTPVQVKLNPPEVTTGAATNVTTTSATLNGTVNAKGLSTTAWFEYGTVKVLYSSVSSTQSVAGSNDTSVQISISGLSSDTTYYYRIVAENSAGTTYGSEYSFKTPASSTAIKAIAQTNRATVTKSNATIGIGNILAVACGGGHTMCMRSDGAVQTFGSNYDGQLGDGTNDDTSTPVYVSNFSGVITTIAGGNWHTAAMESDGTVWVWGSNYNGQLGDGTYDRKNTPVQVQNINLIQTTGNIYGYIKDTTGNYIEGATISLASKKAKVLETTVSDSNGYFKFENFVANNYIIFAKKQGYKPGKLIIKLEAGETKEVEIEIKPKKQ